MLALTLAQAKTIAAAVALLMVIGAALSLWLIKEITKKILFVAIMLVVAFAFWNQRSALHDCAEKVRSAGFNSSANCSFFGSDVSVPSVRSDN